MTPHFNIRHEHLYHNIDRNVLRSDDFASDLVGASRQLLGSRVILCTLSMLSNDKIGVFTHIVPIQTVVFDEASQIEIGDYLPMLIRFRPSLRKLIFIGDNKQRASDGLCSLFVYLFYFQCHHTDLATFQPCKVSLKSRTCSNGQSF